MQVKGPGLTIGCQQFPDVVHLLARLLGRFELLKRDQRRCQRFRDDPFVVAGNSLFWHDDPHPLSGQRKQFPAAIISSNRKSSPVPLQFSLAFDARVARKPSNCVANSPNDRTTPSSAAAGRGDQSMVWLSEWGNLA